MQQTLEIYDAHGNLLLNTPINEGCKWKYEIMKEDYITVKFSLSTPLHFGIGSYTHYEGETFVITETQDPTYSTSTGGYDYELTFNHDYYLWANKTFKFTPEYGGREASWEFCGPLKDLCAVFLKNLQTHKYNHNGQDYAFAYAASLAGISKSVSFNNTNMIDALTDIAEAYDTEWWVEGNTIHLEKCERETVSPLAFKVGENLENITRSDSQSDYANLIYVFGGTNNIPARYRKKLLFDVKTVEDNVISDTARVLDEASYFPAADVTAAEAVTKEIKLVDNSNFPDFDIQDGHESAALPWGDYTYVEDSVATTVIKNPQVNRDYMWAGKFGSLFTLEKETDTGHFKSEKYIIDLSNVGIYAVMGNAGDELKVYLYHGFKRDGSYADEQLIYECSGQHMPLNINLGKVEYTPQESSTSDVVCIRVYCQRTFVSAHFLDDVFSLSISGVFSVTRCPTYKFEFSAKLKLILGKDLTEELEATLNPNRTEAGKNTIVLPDGTTAKVGDYFTISNIVSAKVPVSYFTNDIEESMTVNGVVQSRLMLPLSWKKDGKDYTNSIDVADIGMAEELADAEIVEAVVVNDDIFPQFMTTEEEGNTLPGRVIDSVKTKQRPVTNETTGEKETVTYWAFQDKGFDFDISYKLDEATLYATFQSGLLSGMTFEVLFHKDGGDTYGDGQWFEVKRSDDYGRYLPDSTLCPAEGDRYILTGWDASYIGDTLVDDAEARLLEWGKTYLKELQVDPSTYTCDMMSNEAYGQNPDTGKPDANYSYDKKLSIGVQVELFSKAYFKTGSRVSRIIGWEKNLDIPYDTPQYIVGEKSSYSRIGELSDKVDTLTLGGSAFKGVGSGSGGTSIYILTTGDNTTPTDYNVLSALRSLQSFLRKDTEDTATGVITFLKGLLLGESGNYALTEEGLATLATLTIEKLATLANLLVSGSTILRGDVTSGNNYTEETPTTWGITKVNEKTQLTIDRLYVRAKAIFQELEIRCLKYTGGNRVASPAGSTIKSVTPLDATGNPIAVLGNTTPAAYLCTIQTDDGDKATENPWQVGDFACLQEFNVTTSHLTSQTGNRVGIWLVIAVSQNTYNSDGTLLNLATITLGNLTGQHDGTDAPQVGDTLVSKGNLEDTERDNYIVERTNGTDAPSYEMFSDVHAFSDIDNPSRRTALISPRQIQFRTQNFSILDYDGTTSPVTIYRGTYDPTATYNYYNLVTYNGTLWLLDNIDSGSTLTGVQPNSTNTQWTPQTAHQTIDPNAATITPVLKVIPSSSTQFIASADGTVTGEVTLTAHLLYGNLDITDIYPASAYNWEIDGNPALPNGTTKTIQASAITDDRDHVRCYIDDSETAENQPTLLTDHLGLHLTDSSGQLLYI